MKARGHHLHARGGEGLQQCNLQNKSYNYNYVHTETYNVLEVFQQQLLQGVARLFSWFLNWL